MQRIETPWAHQVNAGKGYGGLFETEWNKEKREWRLAPKNTCKKCFLIIPAAQKVLSASLCRLYTFSRQAADVSALGCG